MGALAQKRRVISSEYWRAVTAMHVQEKYRELLREHGIDFDEGYF